ncbi:predicted membrane protein involved in D-alanine export [Clostridium sp. CAG:411]|jgi:alginate O-acetyltransferase complex protein AlgI|nr:predicted membrane protein involved in D-alanine export [Clostridium sp. CAG:411]
MLFSSNAFIFRFLLLFMIIYFIAQSKYRNGILLAGSLIFYGIGEPKFVWIMLASVMLNYVLSKRIYQYKGKGLLIVTILLNVAVLGWFKYLDFGIENINAILGKSWLTPLEIALPIGISFYTFQILSYQVDCYKGKIKRQVTFIEFATYICMFPQLVAGPIVLFDEVEANLQKRGVTVEKIEDGLKWFTFGLGLKVLLANSIYTLWNTILSAGTIGLGASVAWLGAIAYTFQIYFDFWGYSLMALGLGKMLGFTLPENFKQPYISKSIAEFWRRWHITLGRWFREYVYIPLGGNRKGKIRTIVNLFVVWALTGLWHGASWNFVIWGISFFVFIAIEKLFLGKWLERSKVIGHLYVIFLIPISWVVFAISDFTTLKQYLGSMFGHTSGKVLMGMSQFQNYVHTYWWLLLICIIFATPLPYNLFRKQRQKPWMIAILVGIFFLSVYEILKGSSNPFLYFNF